MSIISRPSPNFNDRKHPVSMLVLHYTGMETGNLALDRLCDVAAGVSAHYLVAENGDIYALVAEEHRAWHAGKGGWRGMDDINSRSIGIEIVNGGHDWPNAAGSLPPYPDIQIEAVMTLCRGILGRHDIPAQNIIGHSDMAPARKQDPGEHFPWRRLAQAGISIFPKSKPSSASAMPSMSMQGSVRELLMRIGYPLDDTTSGAAPEGACILAFQRRFMPHHMTGVADNATLSYLSAVAARFSEL